MLPDTTLRRIVAKELTLFFASPVAYLFLAAFAAVTLFVFFWGEAFFARNIADVRPLFEWMPLLLIFLSAALTMRSWSEERRSGTLEHVLTQPVPLWRFVVGKFLACLLLLVVALAITLPLPVTVEWLGDLDWGPVVGGYLAALLLGAAYLAIGLFVSARSDNAIVSLITTAAVGGLLYLVGSPLLTHLVGNVAGEWLRLLGSGSRFESVTRGVIDLRDLFYFLSLAAAFLVLNVYALERGRWAATGDRRHHRGWQLATLLLVANAIGGNLWLGQLGGLRADLTEGRLYSISDATRDYLAQLREPLLIRGYFSAKTHPLLAPLVPQLRDLLKEYEVAGQGRVRVEFIDPASDPEAEQEANEKYGIRPVPFQVADRYQAAVVNSYFNLLVQYGDEHQVLGFRDLIEVKVASESDIDVLLRNPEYDITSAVKKVLYSYQSGGNLFDSIQGEVRFTGYVSPPERLPEQLVTFRKAIESELEGFVKQSGGTLKVQFVDPEAAGGEVARRIERDFGFKPMLASLFDRDPFYFYLTLAQGDQIVQIPLGDLKGETFRRAFESGLKRFARGFTKTVALVAPSADPQMARFGLGGASYNELRAFLGAELNIVNEDLSDGQVDPQADILMLVAPKGLDEKALFAVDQFLMRGGTVLAATSPYAANLTNRSLSLEARESGLEQWLAHHGIEIEERLVLDPRNSAFPVPVTRRVGGFNFQELRMLDYPYFVDVRDEGLNDDSPITRDLPQATLAWASPIRIDADKNQGRTITELLHSSAASWTSDSLDVMPRVSGRGVEPFAPSGEQKPHLLGVIAEGRFDSYFTGKSSPLLEAAKAEAGKDKSDNASADEKKKEEDAFAVGSVIERSPESARLILFSSGDFLRDRVVQLLGSARGGQDLNTLQLAANTIDWALEDRNLLSIRSRGHFNRTLPAMEANTQRFWEWLNYLLAIGALAAVALIQRLLKQRRQQRYLQLLAG
ncbi:MAG: hypothetical protein Kow006_18760 [Gammaproteobacteria bacterium]